MAWTTPIQNRTSADLAELKLLIQKMMSVGWMGLSGTEQTLWRTDHKGAWNVSDVNRVIGNNNYLRDLLLTYGFEISFSDQTPVTASDIVKLTSIHKVYIDNLYLLYDSFNAKADSLIINTVPRAHSTFDLDEANKLEIDQIDLYTLLQNLIAELKFCGTYYSGDDISL